MAHYDPDDYPYRHRDDDYHSRHDRPQARPRMSSNYTSANYLYPDPAGGGGGLHRSRSQGHRPAPEIHIHNDMYQDNYQRAEAVSPPNLGARGRPAYRPEAEPVFYPVGVPQPQPMMIMAPGFSRSRSRSRSDAGRRRSGEYWQDMIRVEEMKRREADQRAKDDQERAIADYERRKEREKEDQKRAIDKYTAEQIAKKKQQEEEEAEAVRKWEKEQEDKKRKKKEAEEEAVRKWQKEQEDKKAKEKAEEEEWRRKLKEKEEAEKAKKKKEQEEEDEAVRKRLAKIGFRNNQIEAMIHVDDKKKSKSTALALVDGGRPTFPKIKREHIALETLKYYDLPWEYDRHDRDFIIILQEMDENETNVLFAHTRRLRERTTLTIEARKGDKPEYAWVRRRSKSRGKSPARRDKVAEFVVRGP